MCSPFIHSGLCSDDNVDRDPANQNDDSESGNNHPSQSTFSNDNLENGSTSNLFIDMYYNIVNYIWSYTYSNRPTNMFIIKLVYQYTYQCIYVYNLINNNVRTTNIYLFITVRISCIFYYLSMLSSLFTMNVITMQTLYIFYYTSMLLFFTILELDN